MNKMEMPGMGKNPDEPALASERAKAEMGFREKLFQKYPKLKPILMAGLLGITGFHPETGDGSQMTSEDALKNVSDPEFVEQVRNFQQQMDDFGSRIPDNAIYAHVGDFRNVDNGSSDDEVLKGELPDTMENFALSVDSMLKIYSASKNEDGHMFDGSHHSIFMVPVEGKLVEKGGKIEMAGYGADRDSAIRDAYKNLINLTGFRVSTDTEVNSRVEDSSKEADTKEEVKETIKSNGLLLIKEARVMSVDPNSDKNMHGAIKAVIEVQPGTYRK